MNISQAYAVRPTDPLLNPEIDGIAHSFAVGTLRRDETINEWIARGVDKYTAFRWITLAEGI